MQDIFTITQHELDLPQIVVIGSQSSGKSSVLENLVGRDFLPRGSGIVTRRPLILQLNHITEDREWGEFKHKPSIKMERFDMIKQEIINETERSAGRNKGITDEPLLLRIYSNKVVNLTLVDLPGITRIPVGDQPDNIEELLVNMTRRYIEKPNSIILAVHAANQDIATSDALKLAKEVDPTHIRTIGVLTKVDLMDRGTSAMDLIEGKEMGFMSEWVPIVSRSQQDIENGKRIEDSLKDEIKFFSTHPQYSRLGDRCGTRYLAEKCNRLLTDHIRKTLPHLKQEINAKIKMRKNELRSYGEPIQKDSIAKESQLIHILNKFHSQFKSTVEGYNVDIGARNLVGGARIKYILNESFPMTLDNIRPLEGLTLQDIRIVLRNASGMRSAILVPDKAFEQLSKRQIEYFKEPTLRIAEMIYYELNRIIVELDNPDLTRFPRLRERVLEVSTKVTKKCLKETNRCIENFFDFETSYINTNHPDFEQIRSIDVGKKEDVIPDIDDSSSKITGFFSSILFGKKGKQPDITKESTADINIDDHKMSPKERTQVQTVISLMTSYLKISKKTTIDQATKIIMHKLVYGSIDNLMSELVSQLTKSGNIDELLNESQDIEIKRQKCKEDLERLTKAKSILVETEMYE